MAYSESLAARVRDQVAGTSGITEKRMFGGLGFLLHGNMCVGVWKTSLIVRLGPGRAEEAMRKPHVRPFDITGRAMKGWAMIEPDGLETDDQLAGWIEQSVEFVRTLPPK